ncbi:hypothetical protein CVT25_007416 [Psilocybe cyanescens]|uniref:Uncharacterized protein n=1 Tax=Psilocybe cyanescens TaxID=93625 RepID=A0A409XGD0_PSICY|nr:hypothetical protein CVT25_007416 [Psilocybe cyanescens]
MYMICIVDYLADGDNDLDHRAEQWSCAVIDGENKRSGVRHDELLPRGAPHLSQPAKFIEQASSNLRLDSHAINHCELFPDLLLLTDNSNQDFLRVPRYLQDSSLQAAVCLSASMFGNCRDTQWAMSEDAMHV